MASPDPQDIFDEEPINVDSIQAKQNLNDPGSAWKPHNENWGINSEEEEIEEEDDDQDNNRDRRRDRDKDEEPEEPTEGEPSGEPSTEPTGEPSIGEPIEGEPLAEGGAEGLGEAGAEGLGEAGAEAAGEAGLEAGAGGAGAATGEAGLAGAGAAAEAGAAGAEGAAAVGAGAVEGAAATAEGIAATGEVVAEAGVGIAEGGWIVLVVAAVIIIVIIIVFIIAAVVLPAGKEGGFGPGEAQACSSSDSAPCIYQSDPEWANEMWGSNTFAASACGLTSLDMAIASWKGWTTKKDYNLHDFAHKLRDLLNRADECHWSAGGLDPSCIMQAPAKFGLQDPVNLGFDWQKAKGYLKKGVPVISSYSKGYWTSNSHFILLVGIDNNGKILVNDPNPNNCSHGCKTFCHEPVDENKVDGTGGGSLTGGFYAILGPNGQEGTVSCEAGGSGKLAQGNYAELKAELKRLIKKGVFRIQMPACAGADIDNNSIKEDMLRLTVTVGKKLEAEGLHIDISVFMKCHNPGTCHNPLGEAGDFADGGDRENLKKVTRVVMPWLYKNRKDFKIWQLIFDSDQIGLDSNKYNIGDGIHFAYPEATLIEHQNHIHLAAGGCQ